MLKPQLSMPCCTYVVAWEDGNMLVAVCSRDLAGRACNYRNALQNVVSECKVWILVRVIKKG